MVKKGLVGKEIGREDRKINWTKWWDKDCRRQKRYVKKMYIKWKESIVSREEYVTERERMKKLVEKKEEEQRVWTEIGEAKSQTEIWECISKEKKRGKEMGTQISMENWTNHFTQELGEAKQKIEGTKRKEEEEDEEIMDRLPKKEIDYQLTRVKKKKAAGMDRMAEA